MGREKKGRVDGEFPIKQFDPDIDPTALDFPDPIAGYPASDLFLNPPSEIHAPTDDAFAARWQESSFKWLAATFGVLDPPLDHECLELSRFLVPPGRQGIITHIETSLLVKDMETGDMQMLPFFLNPYWPWLFGAFPAHAATIYHLRLESWDKQAQPGAQRRIHDRRGLPGSALPELGSWDDFRYDFSRTPGVQVQLGIPEGHYVSLWQEWNLFPGAPDPQPAIPFLLIQGGRLAGYTQGFKGNSEATANARRTT